MRLIDTEGIRIKPDFMHDVCGVAMIRVEDIVRILNEQPTIEPERKKGKWIKKMLVTETEKYISYDPKWYCSYCGTAYDSHIAKFVNFCYVCGADMRGEQE